MRGETQSRRPGAARLGVAQPFRGRGASLPARRRRRQRSSRRRRRARRRHSSWQPASRSSTQSTHKDVESANVVARLQGSDPKLENEHVVYVAHVDHFGRGVAMNGDDIYNGAHDNASGVAIVLEVAQAYATLPARPRRSILFLFVTAEERGLLGSDFFARQPTVPREGIVANLTLDMPFMFHPLLDIVPYGAQHSTLSAPVTRAAEQTRDGNRHRSHPRAGAVHPQRPLQLRPPRCPVAVHQERLQERRSGEGRRGDQRGVSARRLSQAQRRHVAGRSTSRRVPRTRGSTS